MQQSVSYICPKDGRERTTTNIQHKIDITYNISEGVDEIEGSITAVSKMIVRCSCENDHEIITAVQTEHL